MTPEKPQEREAALAEYAAGPARLAAALEGLDDRQLDLASPGSAAGDWTIRQLAHHIVDGDDLWKTPIKIALGQPAVCFSLEWYWSRPQDEWAGCWDYAGRPLAPSLALFRANREHIVQLLEHVPEAWERVVNVRWPDGREEPVTAGDIVGMQARHAAGHVADIALIRGKHGV